MFWIFLYGLYAYAEPSKITVLENRNRKIERFFHSEGLEYKKIASNQKGWNGVSRGYFSTALYEDEVVSSKTMKSIYKTWNVWSVLPNLAITKSEDVYPLLKANRGALYLPHFDLSLLEECPEIIKLQDEHVYIRGSHTIRQALFSCNPTVLFDLERVKKIEVPLTKNTLRWIKRVHIDGELDEESVQNLRTFTGPVAVHASRFPKWLEEGTSGAQWNAFSLYGVTSLTKSQAQIVGQFSNKTIILHDVQKISPAIAKELSGKGKLILPNLKKIDAKSMEYLTQQRKWLKLGITSIKPNVLSAIQGSKNTKIELPNIHQLSIKTIKRMHPKMRFISTGVMKNFTPKHIEASVKANGNIYLRLEKMGIEHWQALKNNLPTSKYALRKNSMRSLLHGSGCHELSPDVVPKILARVTKEKFRFAYITNLSAETAQIIQDEMTSIRMPALETVSNEALEVLANTEEVLELDGIQELNPEQARILGSSQAKVLSLKGITYTSTDALKELIQFSGTIHFPNWLLYKKEASPFLINHGASLHTSQLHPDVFPKLKDLKQKKLQLMRLSEITIEQAEYISQFSGNHLEVNLPEVTYEHTKALSQFQGASLSLVLRTDPQSNALTGLTQYKGSLHIHNDSLDLPPLQDEHLLELFRTFQGKGLSIGNMESLSANMIEALSETEYEVYLQAKSLSKDAITALKTHKNRVIHAYIESDTTCGSTHYSHFKNEYCDYLYEIEQEQRYEEEQRRRMEEE